MEEALKASAVLTEYRCTMNPGLSPLGEKWIPREPRSVASARRFVRDVATDWKASGDTPEIAELLASELVTNVLAYGSPDVPAVSPVRVTVGRERESLTVDVHDTCIAVPRLGRAGGLEISGPSQAWSRHRPGPLPQLGLETLTPRGKSVWFQLTAWP
ncbi:ATP-binding protein [Streptosporangium sp. LJ11]|uniref:ATP-binding protein n=1 Tax=Streptosporangium sp. LJ11 TaxID=3436927 RepID=UPI003F79D2A2